MTDFAIRPRAVYSQAQQDVTLARIFGEIGVTNKFCVEFGFNAETLDGGSGSNAARLIVENEWTGLLLDKDYQNSAINLHRVTLTPENIGEVFRAHGVPTEPDYVSIDVDSIDLWLFKALLQAAYRPRVVSVEYNSNYGIEESVTVRPGTVNTNDQCYGASLAALYKVGQEFNYRLVDVEPGLDMFFVRADVWGGKALALAECESFTRLSVHPVPTPQRVAAVMMEYR